MSSSSYRRPEPCGHENCGSRRFHEGDDGFTYCDRGHQQSERGTFVSQDTGELVLTGRKAKRKDSDAESNTSRASGFSGPKAFEHYLLCLQLVLRKQLRWLIEVKKLPEELESLVRDLWTLRLQKLQSKVSYDSETETEGQSQYFSSQSEGETSASATSRRSRRASQAKIEGTVNVLDAVTLCYIGTILLREPITVADLYCWMKGGELLYYRASKQVPLGMRERLPPAYQELLEPQLLDSAERLQQNMIATLVTLNKDYGMSVPPINHSLILYRWVRELALPIEVYAATTRLAKLLDLKFAWKLVGKKGEKDVVLRYPEARLMALLIVAAKLLFPPDDVKRFPAAATDLAALSIDWNAWVDLHSSDTDVEVKGARKLRYAQAIDFSQSDILDAGDEQLDQYMDWFERNMASEDIRERGQAGRSADFRRTLFGLFPASDKCGRDPITTRDDATDPVDDVKTRLRRAQSLLKPKRIVDDSDAVDRSGSFYRRYRSSADLKGAVKVLYERAAELAGLSIEGMVRAVFLVERKVQKYEEGLRKGDEV